MENRNNELEHMENSVDFIGNFSKAQWSRLLEDAEMVTEFIFSVIDYKGDAVVETKQGCPEWREPDALDDLCKNCRTCRAMEAARAAIQGETVVYTCGRDLTYIAVPIIYSDRYIGSVISGGIPEVSQDKVSALSHLVETWVRQMVEQEDSKKEMNRLDHLKKHLGNLRETARKQEWISQERSDMADSGQILPELMLGMLVTISNFAILEDAQATEEIVGKFSSVMRYYVDAPEMVPMKTEFEQMQAYVDVLEAQYAGRVRFRLSCYQPAESLRIPSLSIFPYLFYIVSKGIQSSNFEGIIYISADYWNSSYHIILQMESRDKHYKYHLDHIEKMNQKEEKHLDQQISSTRKRLKYAFGEQCVVEMKSNMIDIVIPPGADGEER